MGNVMAGGEKAKSSGEYGEAIVGNLLKLIGWENSSSGISVPCVFKEKHTTKEAKNEREKHGIDYVYQYKSPLRDATKQEVLISVKCRDGYPATEDGIKKKFKEFLLELAHASECYPSCDLSKKKIQNTTKKVTSGLIFWIDRNREDGRENEGVIDKIGNFYLREECSYDVISLVDNKKAQFLYSLISFAQTKYGADNVEFFYINTGLNNASLDRIYTGSFMPVEYINSNVIPLAVTNGDSKTLFLGTNDNFCKEYLSRLIGLAQELTSTWTANVVIAFPDYNEFENGEDVISTKNTFQSSVFVNKIEVVTFNPDFRDGVK